MKDLNIIRFFVVIPALLATGACSDDDAPAGAAGSSGNAGSAGASGSGGSGATAGSSGSGGSSGTAGSNGTSGSGGAGAAGGTGDGGTMMGRLRVAHLSPDAPAVDVCVNPGSGFIGPVLATAGDSNGLAYPEVTSYVAVPAATYSVRIVAPGSANCNTALASLPDVTGVAVAANSDYTAAAVGMLTPGASDDAFSIKLLLDDNTPDNSAKGYLRFVHASPDAPAVDVGLGSGSSFTAVWTDVEFGEVGQVSGKNYVETDPIANGTVSARATGTTADALVIPGANLPAGAVATAFAIGNLDGTPKPLKVLLCVDSAAMSTCSVVP
jgi:hypothetical protein